MKSKIQIILLSFIFSSCFHSVKVNESQSKLNIPLCASDEVLVCKKIKEKEVKLVKLMENEYPSFKLQWDKSIERAFELNEKYLLSVATKDISYNFDTRVINYPLLLKTTRLLREILKNSKDDEELNRAIKEKFDVYELRKGTEPVLFTSYYEPVFEASLKKDDVFRFPLYRVPDDMYEINLEEFDPDRYKGQKLTGRISGRKFIPYYSRSEIDFDGVLSGKSYEIAYLKDITDLLDLHTQGSGILKLREGGYKRARYAATNSLKFKGWMGKLLEMGYIKREENGGNSFYERAKDFINKNPQLWREVIGANKRYTFFYLDDLKSFDEGPIGTYGLNLVGGRSIAVDNSIIPLGITGFINLKLPVVDDNLKVKEYSQERLFVFAQDTGGAIKGARVDFFSGTGDKAKTFAYSVMEKGNFYLLVAKDSK